MRRVLIVPGSVTPISERVAKQMASVGVFGEFFPPLKTKKVKGKRRKV